MGRATNPYDNPEKLIDRLLFPSLRDSWASGWESGYLDGKLEGIDQSFISFGTLSRDRKWLTSQLEALDLKENSHE